MKVEAQMLAEDGPVVKTLRDKFPHAMAVYAFGSQVHGTADAQSDLDLGILVAGYADALALWDTASDLSAVILLAVRSTFWTCVQLPP